MYILKTIKNILNVLASLGLVGGGGALYAGIRFCKCKWITDWLLVRMSHTSPLMMSQPRFCCHLLNVMQNKPEPLRLCR